MFTINIAKGVKKQSTPKPNRISRLCWGEVIEVDNEFKIKISLRNDPAYPDYLVVHFSSASIDLKGKTEVYSYQKDKLNNYIKHIRDKMVCKLFPGSTSQFTVVVPGNICSGFVIRNNGKLFFEIKKIHGRGYNALNEVKDININTPLFYEHNKSSK